MLRVVPKSEVPRRAKFTLVGICIFFVIVNIIRGIDGGAVNLFFAMIFATAATLMIVLWKTKKPTEDSPTVNGEHGTASWAMDRQFETTIQHDNNNGLWIGDGWRRNKSGHLITVASSGSGKGAGILIPNLLIHPSGSYVITDPKGENACITARAQKEFGQRVFIIDPWDEEKKIGARHGIEPSGFNPFDFIKTEPDELRDNCEQIASFLVPDKQDVKDPYWNDRARTLIKTLLMHIVTGCPKEEHNFWTLYKMLRYSGDTWLNLLLDMKENEGADGLISIAAEEFLGLDPSGPTLTGIRSSAQNATTIFESPQLRRSLEKSDFNPYDLPNGDCTVYIVIPERFLDTHATWLRLVIGLCLKACNSKPNKRVNFFLDEFAIMGKMKDVQKGFAYARGQNISMWIFAQNLSQLKEIYGEDGMKSLIGNAGVFQCFGIDDPYTMEYVSKMLGDATYMKQSHSYSSSDSPNGGNTSNTSYQTYGRRLMTPEEVGKYPGIIVLTEGLKYTLSKIYYYKNRYAGVSLQGMNLTPEDKQRVKEGKLPRDWSDIFAPLADPRPREYVR